MIVKLAGEGSAFNWIFLKKKKCTSQNTVLKMEKPDEIGANSEHSPHKSLMGFNCSVRVNKKLCLLLHVIGQVQVTEESDCKRMRFCN
jgi:hypothetical protein